MARARNIKPSIMDNDQLADLEPLARLLFIYLWMLADRNGRLEDRPKRIAAQALPFDRDADVDAMLDALAGGGFLTRYKAKGVAVIQITNFAKHQTPHVREADGTLPPPDETEEKHNLGTDKAMPRSCLGDAEPSPRSPDSLIPDSLIEDSLIGDINLGARKPRSPTGSRIPAEFPTTDDIEFCRQQRPDLDASTVAASFRDYWAGVPGAKGRKADWPATWRNWVRNQKREYRPQPRASPVAQRRTEVIAGLTGQQRITEVIDVTPARIG